MVFKWYSKKFNGGIQITKVKINKKTSSQKIHENNNYNNSILALVNRTRSDALTKKIKISLFSFSLFPCLILLDENSVQK